MFWRIVELLAGLAPLDHECGAFAPLAPEHMPSDRDRSARVAERAVFRGVGAKFMKRHADGLDRLGAKFDGRPGDGEVGIVARKERQLRADQRVERHRRPGLAGQEIGGARQRCDAFAELLVELLHRAGERGGAAVDRADHGQHVLGAVDDLLRDDLARFLVPPALGDVAVNVRDRDDPAVRVADRCGGDPDQPFAPGLRHARRLEACQRAGDDLVAIFPDALREARGIENLHRLADDLAGGIAIETLRRRVPGGYAPGKVVAYDRVVRRGDKRAEKCSLDMRLGCARRGGSARGNLGVPQEGVFLAVLVERTDGQLEPAVASVAIGAGILERGPAAVAQGCPEGCGDAGRLFARWPADVEIVPADEAVIRYGAAALGKAAPCGIHGNDVAVDVHHGDLFIERIDDHREVEGPVRFQHRIPLFRQYVRGDLTGTALPHNSIEYAGKERAPERGRTRLETNAASARLAVGQGGPAAAPPSCLAAGGATTGR